MKKQPKTIRKRTKRSNPLKDLTGKRFGKWVVQKYAGKKGRSRLWLCRCDCGVQNNVHEFSLIKGSSKQCKRCAWDSYVRPLPKDLTGKRFGKWVVLESVGNQMWLCRCDCGVQKNVHEFNLINKRSTQCLRCSWAKRSMGYTKSYFAWQRLKQNGSLPKEWQGYEAFIKDIGDPPSNDARLLRYNKYKPHAPGNTYWAIIKRSHLGPQMSKILKEQAILDNKMLMKIRMAKTREEMICCMVAARKAGCKYEMIGLAAGLSRQRVHIIVTKHLGK